MESLFRSILLGLSISAPIGPVNAAQIDKGIKNGFLHAWLVGLGAMAADLLYMTLVFLGVVHFISQPFLKTFLWLFGGFVMIYTGLESLKGVRGMKPDAEGVAATKWSTFWTGFLMSASSPLSILFWLGIYGAVIAESSLESNLGDLLKHSGGIILGIVIWDISMAALAGVFRKLLSERLLTAVSIVSGVSLLGFGGYFGIHAIRLLIA
ncbi:LysE family transporter [Cohnella caldifontis]|uniref:LysE family transporter n=1 Tax=Cohnella caldifontis TaxID=3027471 RepID=UPI0023EB9F33|nr:LysE family transporter [Cohnella sp. YIM B05605]